VHLNEKVQIKWGMFTILADSILQIYYYYYGNLDNIVCAATAYELDGRGSIPGRGKRFFCTPQRPDRLWGPPSLISNVYLGFSLGVKRPGREVHHSLLSSA
jgi:hypothetical protein